MGEGGVPCLPILRLAGAGDRAPWLARQGRPYGVVLLAPQPVDERDHVTAHFAILGSQLRPVPPDAMRRLQR